MAAKKNDCIGCGDTPPTTTADGAIVRRAIAIKVKVIALVPVNAADGAYEAVAQKAVSDALSVGGALIQSATSKTKPA